MNRLKQCGCIVLLTALSGCSQAVNSIWVDSSSIKSSLLDDIDPESKMILEAALSNDSVKAKVNNGDLKSRSSNDRDVEMWNTRLPGIPKSNVPEISHFINYYSRGSGKAYVQDGYQRRKQYFSVLATVLDRYGLPLDLVNIPFVESRYKTAARSPQGAFGLWQFMRPTARNYGLQVSYFADERGDVIKSTHAAARHLRELHDIFDDWYLALAAYNAGVGRVQEAIRNGGGTRDFFELSKKGLLPKETREYVAKFLAISHICRNPKNFGLDERGETLVQVAGLGE